MNVLLVEDSPRDAELIERELKRAGINARAERVETEAQMRDALQQRRPDVILVDYHLPRFDGAKALQVARALVPDTPFIFVSGSIGEERAVEALKEGATDYILKDRLQRLGPAVLRALEERRRHQATLLAQEALRISEERLKFALLATDALVWDWTISQDRVWTNGALQTYWGYENLPTEIDRFWLRQQIHPEDQEAVRTSVENALEQSETWTAGYRFRHANGFYRDVLARAFIVRDDRGSPTRLIGAMIDVHDRIVLERELARARRVDSLGRVAATMAHEFNNVLMGVQTLAELLRKRSNPELAARAGEQIEQSVKRGKRITESILRFTRSLPPERRNIELRSWLQQLLPELSSISEKIQIELKLPAQEVTLSADPAQLHQVLLNLLLNARDAMASGGRVTLTLERVPAGEHRSFGAVPGTGAFALLSMRDTGAGMSPEVLERIFEPLFTTKRHGTGLGLAAAQQIISAHGGHIFVESAPGSGTTFHLLIPSRAVQEEAPSAVVTRPQVKRVLILDDDEILAGGLVALLEVESIEARAATSSEGLFETIDAFRPEAIILDVTFGEVDGLALADRIAERWPDLPILLSSGHAVTEQTPAGRNFPFLQKPYDLDTLFRGLSGIQTPV